MDLYFNEMSTEQVFKTILPFEYSYESKYSRNPDGMIHVSVESVQDLYWHVEGTSIDPSKVLPNGWRIWEEEQFGGEGQGDSYWVVFGMSDGESVRYFRVDGYHISHDGSHLDGDPYEVKPAKKTVTVWE